jgi:hypothetical protein
MAKAREVPVRLPLLSGGMSHQPPNIRFRNQVADAQNMIFSVVDGASKRPGSKFIVIPATLPDSGDSAASASTEPAPPGTAPSTCTPGDHASSYTVTYSITGTDPDGVAISHVNETAGLTQHTSECAWTGSGTQRSSLTPRIFLHLDTAKQRWVCTFLMDPATAQPQALYGNSVNLQGVDPDADADPGYTNTGNFGDSSTTYLLDIKTISVA